MSRAGKDHSCLLGTDSPVCVSCDTMLSLLLPFFLFSSLCSNRGDLNRWFLLCLYPDSVSHSKALDAGSAVTTLIKHRRGSGDGSGASEGKSRDSPVKDPPLPPKTGALLFSQQSPTQEAIPRALQFLLAAELEPHLCFTSAGHLSCHLLAHPGAHPWDVTSLSQPWDDPPGAQAMGLRDKE